MPTPRTALVTGAAQEYSIGRWPDLSPCGRVRARLKERSRFKQLYGDPNWRPGQDQDSPE